MRRARTHDHQQCFPTLGFRADPFVSGHSPAYSRSRGHYTNPPHRLLTPSLKTQRRPRHKCSEVIHDRRHEAPRRTLNSMLLTFEDIPEDYHGHRPEPGPRYHRFAAGLLARLAEAHGSRGEDAGNRLVASAWNLRYAGVGLALHRNAPRIGPTLNEDVQFVYLSGFQLTVTSAAASIDLGAAALTYLAGREQREPDLRQVVSTPLLNSLSAPHQRWVTTTNELAQVDQLMDVRNALLHRHVPTSVTIRLGGLPAYSIRVDEHPDEIAVDPEEAYVYAVDRFVTLGNLLSTELDEAGL